MHCYIYIVYKRPSYGQYIDCTCGLRRRNSLTMRNRPAVLSLSFLSLQLSLSFSLLRSSLLFLFFSFSFVSIAFNLELPRYRITLRSTRLLEVLEILRESHYEFYGSAGTCTNTRWWCNCPTGSLGALFQRFMFFLSLIYRSVCVCDIYHIKTQ